MKVPLSLLKSFLTFDRDAKAVADALTLLGLEVDGILHENPPFSHVVCGEILHVKKHPESDKLLLLEVTDGKKTYPVVCGDLLCQKGEKAAFAPPGAQLFLEDGVKKITATSIRGVHSEGMLCSMKDLGLSEEEERICLLEQEIPNGQDLTSLLWDPILEVSLTPNLGHCLSILGIARELSASWNIPLHIPKASLQETSSISLPEVAIKDPEGCPRYACRKIEGVQIAPSPLWLKRKLECLGLRPVNNVVDCTNLILFEYGHPLHAFDAEKIDGKIEVKRSTEDTPFTFLDEKERLVPKGSLLICDQKKPLALAGIMGGLSSSVTSETKHIVVESAFFDPLLVRKTSKQIPLRTDGSLRFEKGADPNGVIRALDAVCHLIQKTAGGKVSKVSEQNKKEFPMKTIVCRVPRLERLLGQKFSASEIEGLFHRLGFSTHAHKEALTVSVPAYRYDLDKEIDLIEEAARIYGYNHLERKSPYFTNSTTPHHPLFLLEEEARKRLSSLHLMEFLASDLISPSLASLMSDGETPIEVLHSKSEEHKVLRTSLLPGLLQAAQLNLSHKNTHLRGFELGRVYLKKEGEYKEQQMAGVLLTGKKPPHWEGEEKEPDFFTLKGIIQNFLSSLQLPQVRFIASSYSSFHPFRQASLWIEEKQIGTLGEIHPNLLQKLSIDQRVQYSEINLSLLLSLIPSTVSMDALPIYPGSERDVTITLPESVSIGEILARISSQNSSILEKVELTSLYKSEKLGSDKKNATFRFTYRSREKTLSFEEVEKEHARLSAYLNLSQ